MKIKTLSIVSPNGSRIASGHKTIEVRSWLPELDPDQDLLKNIPIPFDVKNQAHVHLWYERKFGYPVEAYEDLEDAISTWPTTSTTVALTKRHEEVRIIAPFGLIRPCRFPVGFWEV